MKYQILHNFRASNPFKEKSSDHKLKLLKNLAKYIKNCVHGFISPITYEGDFLTWTIRSLMVTLKRLKLAHSGW